MLLSDHLLGLFGRELASARRVDIWRMWLYVCLRRRVYVVIGDEVSIL